MTNSNDELRPYQVEGIEFLRSHDRAYLGDDMGLGKCQGVDAPVLTPHGWTRIGDLNVGDLVVSVDGTPTEVTGVFPQGVRPMYRITFSDGAQVTCDPEHLWEVNTATRVYRKATPLIKTAEQLLQEPLVYSNGGRKWRVPTVSPVQFENTGPLTLDPYTLGVLLGDGWFGNHKRDQISVCTDNETLNRMVWPENARVGKIYYSYPDTAPYNGTYKVTGVCNLLDDLGLRGCLADAKFVPKKYLFASVSDRVALLQGLLDSDGTPTASKRGMATTVEYGTISEQLALDVQHLVESLGGLATIAEKTPTFTYKGNKKNGRQYYRMTVQLPAELVPFRLERKLVKWETRQRPVNRYIVSIEPAESQEAVCIRVAHPRHLYVTNRFVVTHNTAQLIKASEGKTLVVAPAMLIDSGNWENEINKWADDPDRFTLASYTRLPGRIGNKMSNKPRPEYDTDWDTVIFDEAHYLKNRNAIRTQVSKRVTKRAERVYLASGTPVSNWSPELFVPFQILHPEEDRAGMTYGSYWNWIERWFKVYNSPYNRGGREIGKLKGCTKECFKRPEGDPCEHYQMFSQANFRGKLIRRLRDEVLTDLPELYHQRVPVTMTKSQWKAYRDMKDDFILGMANQETVAWSTASQFTYLDQLTTSLGMLTDDPLKHSGKFDRLRLDLESRTTPTVIVGHYKNTVHGAARVATELGKSVGVIEGNTPQETRRDIVGRFQSGQLDVLVGTYETISEGLTLTAANMMILIEISYKAARNQQAIRRIHRLGQDQKCHILEYYAVGPTGQKTLDTSKRRMVDEKILDAAHTLNAATLKGML